MNTQLFFFNYRIKSRPLGLRTPCIYIISTCTLQAHNQTSEQCLECPFLETERDFVTHQKKKHAIMSSEVC